MKTIARSILCSSVLFLACAPSPSPLPAAAPVTIAQPEARPSAPREEAATPPPAAPAVAVKPATRQNPSCDGAPGAGNDCNGESCCLRRDVPAGDFDMNLDAGGKSERVHVNAFSMDKYEATVGRIRAWVRAGQPLPADGEVLHDDGKHGPIHWSAKTAAVQNEKQLAGWKRYDTWTGGEEKRPKNSINWYTAAAFCHFEGGRLPTDAEWKYTVAGGNEARPYPWGAEPPTPERAVYNCTGDGNRSCSIADILPVGSRPKGEGRWGHMDLAGSMFEWTMDGGTAEGPGGGGGGGEEVSRGGGFCYIGGVDRRAPTGLKPGVFRKESATTTSHMVGVRCAYSGAKGTI